MKDFVCYAQRKIEESIKNGEPIEVIRYWVGYLDCAIAMEKENKNHD